MSLSRNFDSASNKARYAFWLRSPSVAQYEKGPDTIAGDYVSSLNSAGNNVLPNIGRDANDILRIGGAVHYPNHTPIRCTIQANGKLATQGFFANYNDAELLEIFRIDLIFSVADGAANTAYITKDGAAVAPGAGDSVMTGTFDLNATANTLQTATLVGTPGNASRNNTISGTTKLLIAAGEQLSLKIASAVTSLAGLAVIVWVREFTGQPPAQYYMAANGDIATQTIYLNVIPGQTVRGISMRWSAAGTNAGAVTADVTKDTGTTAPGAGTSMLTAAQSLKGTANTTVFPALTATASVLKMDAKDRIAVKITGTLTALAGLVVTVFFSASCEKLLVIPLANWDAVSTDRTLFIANNRYYEVYDFWATWSTASTSNDKLLTKDTGTTAPGGGTGLLSDNTNAGILTSATANTPVEGTLVTVKPNLIVGPGDRLGVKNANNATGLAGVCNALVLRAA